MRKSDTCAKPIAKGTDNGGREVCPKATCLCRLCGGSAARGISGCVEKIECLVGALNVANVALKDRQHPKLAEDATRAIREALDFLDEE